MADEIEAPRFTAGHWFHGGKNLSIKTDYTNEQAAPAGEACGYFVGKPSQGNCRRCAQSFAAHYPAMPARSELK